MTYRFNELSHKASLLTQLVMSPGIVRTSEKPEETLKCYARAH